MNNSENNLYHTDHFDVFLCHNNDDKEEIRHIADRLIELEIKPWLDEREIPPGRIWQTALEEQITNIKSAAIFVGESGIGPWQDIEIRAFIIEFIKRKCVVIPTILPTAKEAPALPILLKNLQYVDLRKPVPDPWELLKWGITGNKLDKKAFNIQEESVNKLPLLPDKERNIIEIRLPGKIEEFSTADKERLVAAISELIQIDGEVKIIESKPGSIRVFLELSPDQADKIYTAAKYGQLDSFKVTEVRLYPSLANPPTEVDRNQLLILLNRVRENWIEGVLKQSLYNEILISLEKRTIDEAVEPQWKNTINLPTQRQNILLKNSRIDTVFDATGLLLILGEPGSGKTTSLLELASILIIRAESDHKERIPFILNLSSWEKNKTLDDWIVETLNSTYKIPIKLARSWLNKGYLIPLLDGLDEVNTENQIYCVQAINKYIDTANPSGLVVSSRLSEYQWLSERLKLNGAICIEPLDQQQLDSYFNTLGYKFNSLQKAIKEDAVLRELAKSPVMLNVMSIAYQADDSENQIIDKESTIEERRKKIFDKYIDRMFLYKKSINQTIPKEKVKLQLSWLAKKMLENSQSIFIIENLQPNWLGEHKLLYRFIASLFFAGSVGLFLGLSYFLSLISLFSIFDESEIANLHPLIKGLLENNILFFFNDQTEISALFEQFNNLKSLIINFQDFLDFFLKILFSGTLIGLYALLLFLILLLSISLPLFIVVFIFAQWDSPIKNGTICGIAIYIINTLIIVFNTENFNFSDLKPLIRESVYFGLLIGIGLGTLDNIRTIEKVEWSWDVFFEAYYSSFIRIYDFIWKFKWFIIGLSVLRVLFSGSENLLSGLILGVFSGTLSVFILIAGAGFTWSFFPAFSEGFVDKMIDQKISPNQGIFLSIKNAFFTTILSMLALIAFLSLIYLVLVGFNPGIILTIVFAAHVALMIGLNRGFSAALKHYALRMSLSIYKKIPLRLIPFLDYCEKLIFLKKVGNGYIFIHRMLLEHFATLEHPKK